MKIFRLNALLSTGKILINQTIWRCDIAEKNFSRWRSSDQNCKRNKFYFYHTTVFRIKIRICTPNVIKNRWFATEVYRKIFKWRSSTMLNLWNLLSWSHHLWLHVILLPSFKFYVKDNMALRYGRKTIFKMSSVGHLGFAVTSSYCIRELHFMFSALC